MEFFDSFTNSKRVDCFDISKLEASLKSPARDRNLPFSLVDSKNKNLFEITKNVTLAMIYNFPDFTLSELNQNIKRFGGIEKISSTVNLIEYLIDLENLNYLECVPELDVYVSIQYYSAKNKN